MFTQPENPQKDLAKKILSSISISNLFFTFITPLWLMILAPVVHLHPGYWACFAVVFSASAVISLGISAGLLIVLRVFISEIFKEKK